MRLYAKGSINDQSGFTLLVDSGLALRAGIMLAEETMNSLGIPMPELEAAAEGYGGMGGSDFEFGYFDLASYGLGNLQLKNGIGVFMTDTILYYDEFFGFFEDGLISHNYLKDYKWTIDFDSMEMIFSQ